MVRRFPWICLFLFTAFFHLSGCGFAPPSASKKGFLLPPKVFTISIEKKLLYVGVFGRIKGTPDVDKVKGYLETALENGLITGLEQISTGVEGGAGFCVIAGDRSHRETVITDLMKIETDMSQTAYSVISVDSCDCYRDDFVCDPESAIGKLGW